MEASVHYWYAAEEDIGLGWMICKVEGCLELEEVEVRLLRSASSHFGSRLDQDAAKLLPVGVVCLHNRP